MVIRCIGFILLCFLCLQGHSRPRSNGDMKGDSARLHQDMIAYQRLSQMAWKEVFREDGTGDWQDRWSLDGNKARIRFTSSGMEFQAGPVPADDANHSVIWTCRTFSGDIRIDYEYTRLDSALRYVNIIYLFATGSGTGKYSKDILEWSGLRNIPAMSTYYNHMNLLHISYAAFENTNNVEGNDYIRVRRYLPETGRGLEGTGLEPDYLRTGMFGTNVPHRITIIKDGFELYMYIKNTDREMLCHWDLSGFPALEAGRIGIRHMGSRSARYKNLRIYEQDGGKGRL